MLFRSRKNPEQSPATGVKDSHHHHSHLIPSTTNSTTTSTSSTSFTPGKKSPSSSSSSTPFSFSSSKINSKNSGNGTIIQRYEPGIRFPIETFQGKIFLCTKVKETDAIQQQSQQQQQHIPQKLQYLGITQYQIIELIPQSYLSPPTATATPSASITTTNSNSSSHQEDLMIVYACHELNALNKVKFKRSEVITFQFQSGLVKRYYMYDSAECVDYVKQQMNNSGITATHISKKKEYNMTTAQSLLAYVKELEYQFCLHPSHDLVIQMVDLLREAAECLGEANDDRYQSVVVYVQNFLQRDDVIKILDQANHVSEKPSKLPPVGQIPHQQTQPELSQNEFIHSVVPSMPIDQENLQISPQGQSCEEGIQPEQLSTPRSNEPSLPSPSPSIEVIDYENILPPSILNQPPEGSDDDSDCEENNQYLQLQPLNHAPIDPSQIWNEGVSLLQQTLHQIDEDEHELGLILTDLNFELDEILGTPVEERRRKETILRTESLPLSSDSDYMVTFEEYDNFLESFK